MSFSSAVAITPSDAAALPGTYSAFSVGVAGTVRVDTASGQTGVSVTCVAGFVYPLRIAKVYATGTSATGIVGYW